MTIIMGIIAHKLDNAVREANRRLGYPALTKPVSIAENDIPKAYRFEYADGNVVEATIEHRSATQVIWFDTLEG